MRIAFTEQHPNIAPQFRTATIMPVQDAIQLADLMKKLLAPIEAQLAEVENRDG